MGTSCYRQEDLSSLGYSRNYSSTHSWKLKKTSLDLEETPCLCQCAARGYLIRKQVYLKLKNAHALSTVVSKSAVNLANGSIYTGSRDKKGRKHGFGLQVMPDGSRYEGDFSKGEFSGTGHLVKTNGESYKGGFFMGKAFGHGVFVNAEGDKFTGEFKDGLQHGPGTEEFKDGSVFNGNCEKGVKKGKGVLRWPNGSYYDGEFDDNTFNGTGTYVWNNGKKYAGMWRNCLLYTSDAADE